MARSGGGGAADGLAPCPFGVCDGSGFVVDEATNTASDCRCRPLQRRPAPGRAASRRGSRRKYRDVAFDRWPVTEISPPVVDEVRRFCHRVEREPRRGARACGSSGTRDGQDDAGHARLQGGDRGQADHRDLLAAAADGRAARGDRHGGGAARACSTGSPRWTCCTSTMSARSTAPTGCSSSSTRSSTPATRTSARSSSRRTTCRATSSRSRSARGRCRACIEMCGDPLPLFGRRPAEYRPDRDVA